MRLFAYFLILRNSTEISHLRESKPASKFRLSAKCLPLPPTAPPTTRESSDEAGNRQKLKLYFTSQFNLLISPFNLLSLKNKEEEKHQNLPVDRNAKLAYIRSRQYNLIVKLATFVGTVK